MSNEKLMSSLKALKLGLEYGAKLAVEKQLDERKKGRSGQFHCGRGRAYKEAAGDLGRIIKETEKERMPEGDVEEQ